MFYFERFRAEVTWENGNGRLGTKIREKIRVTLVRVINALLCRGDYDAE